MPALSSAWAPFLVHAASFLRPGGRLAVVAPFEITYARYARPLVEFLGRSFGSLHCLLFDRPLFPELNENTVLLLCDGYGQTATDVALYQLGCADELVKPLPAPRSLVPVSGWAAGVARTRLYDLPAEAREVLARATAQPGVTRLGQVARVTIGYVTGDNAYFHPSDFEIASYELRSADVRLAVRDSSDLALFGLQLTTDDASKLASRGEHQLFYPAEPLHPTAAAYVAYGESAGVQHAYKCRSRQPWYRVPGVAPHGLCISLLSTSSRRARPAWWPIRPAWWRPTASWSQTACLIARSACLVWPPPP